MRFINTAIVLVLMTVSLIAEDYKITDIFYNENKIEVKVSEDKLEYSINFDEGSRVLFLEFSKSSIDSKIEIPKVKGELLEKCEYITFEDNTDFFITLQKGVTYKAYKGADGKTLILEFTKKEKTIKKPSIVIDAGHGGKDPGAVANGYLEKEIALKVALKMKDMLSEEFNVTLTRDSDVFIPLPDRPRVANEINADLFISFHINAIPGNPSANGVEVFYYSRNESAYAGKIASVENSVDEKYGIKTQVTDIIVNDLFYQINQEKSTGLATLLVDEIAEKTGFNKRPKGGAYGANFAVLRGSKMPAVLIEFGFLTNKAEAKKMADDYYQEKLVEGVLEALKKYFFKG